MFLKSPLLTGIDGLCHRFFTRKGGYSSGFFESLNVSNKKGDLEENIEKNCEEISQTMGFVSENLILLNQKHGIVCQTVTAPQKGLEGDALLTQAPGLLLGIQTADCVPILLCEPSTRTIAAIHAGWRGACLGIISSTVKRMVALGAHAPSIKSAIGPCIFQDSYEVGLEVYDQVDEKQFFRAVGGDHFLFDLPGFVIHQLRSLGVKEITPPPYNTYTHPDLFFSCRRAQYLSEPSFGCQLSVIGWCPQSS